MSREIILDRLYRQVPAGWTSAEQTTIGTLRVIDNSLYYAFECYIKGSGFGFRRMWETIWLPVKASMLESQL